MPLLMMVWISFCIIIHRPRDVLITVRNLRFVRTKTMRPHAYANTVIVTRWPILVTRERLSARLIFAWGRSTSVLARPLSCWLRAIMFPTNWSIQSTSLISARGRLRLMKLKVPGSSNLKKRSLLSSLPYWALVWNRSIAMRCTGMWQSQSATSRTVRWPPNTPHRLTRFWCVSVSFPERTASRRAKNLSTRFMSRWIRTSSGVLAIRLMASNPGIIPMGCTSWRLLGRNGTPHKRRSFLMIRPMRASLTYRRSSKRRSSAQVSVMRCVSGRWGIIPCGSIVRHKRSRLMKLKRSWNTWSVSIISPTLIVQASVRARNWLWNFYTFIPCGCPNPWDGTVTAGASRARTSVIM